MARKSAERRGGRLLARRGTRNDSGDKRAATAQKSRKGRPGIAVEVVIAAPVTFVWNDVQDISSHVEWMQDAEEIRFLGDKRRGVGTRFECDTVVGPLKLTDVMEITDWEHGRSMGVHHQGIVGGTGEFRLRASGSNTVFSWVEKLHFPWYFAGPIGAMIARPVLRAIWRGNLRRLKRRIESAYVSQRHAEASIS